MAAFGGGFSRGPSSFAPQGPARPPTGGGLQFDPGPQTAAAVGGPSTPNNLFGGAPQGAGFGPGGSQIGGFIPGISNLFPSGAFGGPVGQQGALQFAAASSIPQQQIPNSPQFSRFGGFRPPSVEGTDPNNLPPGFPGGLQEGQGGFNAIPRTLSRREIAQINQDLGIQGTPRQFTTNSFRTRQLLGEFGFIADPSTFNRGQIPAIETNLNFQNLLQAQADRQSALDLLTRQRDVIGQTPEQQLALDVAIRRLENPEPFSQEELDLQSGDIRSRAGRGLEASQRQLSEDLARQGVAGSASSFQQAQLQQGADRQASDELSRLAIENALGRDVNEATAVDRLQGITGENELRQIALNQALTELLTAQRGEFDLSALAGKERKAERGVLSKIGFF